MPTAKNKAYAHLRLMLVHGQIPPGTRLGEIQWAQRLGVHRGALREALSLLAHEGLLDPGEHGGHFVPALERADLDDILELRAALETAAIRKLNRTGQKIDIGPLDTTNQTMRQMLDQKLLLAFAEADRRFHEQIIQLAGNSRMTRAYLQAPVLMSVRLTPYDTDMHLAMKKTLGQHESICQLLEAGSYEQAATRLQEHLFSAHSAAVSAPVCVTDSFS